MKRTALWIAFLAMVGLSAPAAVAETYDDEGGINWFSDADSESVGAFDDGDGLGFDSDLVGDDYDYGYDYGIGENDSFVSDDYGMYDSDFDWDTDDDSFDSWYGESDGIYED